MQYGTLGKTGLRVSRLGFGAMRLPMSGERVDRAAAIPLLHRAFELGVNYIDTAVNYCKGDSQRVVGEAVKSWPGEIIVSTKNHYYGPVEKEWRRHLEESLERLQLESIDVYNTHGLMGDRLDEAVRPRIIKWLRAARDEGLIKHIGTSFHDNAALLRRVIDSDLYECVTVQYNLLDRKLEQAIAYACEKDVGVVIMGPIGGGRLAAPNEILSKLLPDVTHMPELALRFVLSNPHVSIALSGMNTREQVEENTAVASEAKALSEAELKAISGHMARLKRMADSYCTGCGYCMPCPQEVNIPGVFGLYNTAKVYGLLEQARRKYAQWREKAPAHGMQADACIECGKCEELCPQDIEIREQLKEAHHLLAPEEEE